MQDDVYSVAFDGWEAGNEVVKEYVTKKNKDGTVTVTDKVKSWDGRMIPKTLIISTCFPEEQATITRFEMEREDVVRLMDEMREEQGGEDGLLSEVIDKDKITAKRLKDRIKEIKDKPDYVDELTALQEYAKLIDSESTYNAAIRTAEVALDKVAMDKYPTLSLADIKELVINQKWCNTIFDSIDTLFSSISHNLAGRIIDLCERYTDTLPELGQQVEKYEAKVKSHLERMGFVW